MGWLSKGRGGAEIGSFFLEERHTFVVMAAEDQADPGVALDGLLQAFRLQIRMGVALIVNG